MTDSERIDRLEAAMGHAVELLQILDRKVDLLLARGTNGHSPA